MVNASWKSVDIILTNGGFNGILVGVNLSYSTFISICITIFEIVWMIEKDFGE